MFTEIDHPELPARLFRFVDNFLRLFPGSLEEKVAKYGGTLVCSEKNIIVEYSLTTCEGQPAVKAVYHLYSRPEEVREAVWIIPENRRTK